MRITKTFEITFDEPCPNWLCADNLAFALHTVCTNTQFEVVETARNPEYPEEGFNEGDEEINVPPEEASEGRTHMLRGGAYWNIETSMCSYRSDTRPENNLESSGLRIAKRRDRSQAVRSSSWEDRHPTRHGQSSNRSNFPLNASGSYLGFRIGRKA